MSQKKNKKRSMQPQQVGKNPNKLQQTSKNKKMNVLARNLLMIDLVTLGASQMMVEKQMISETMANFIAFLGLIMLVVALYLEFGPKSGRKKGIDPKKRG